MPSQQGPKRSHLISRGELPQLLLVQHVAVLAEYPLLHLAPVGVQRQHRDAGEEVDLARDRGELWGPLFEGVVSTQRFFSL